MTRVSSALRPTGEWSEAKEIPLPSGTVRVGLDERVLCEFTWQSFENPTAGKPWQSIDVVFQCKKAAESWPASLFNLNFSFESHGMIELGQAQCSSSPALQFLAEVLRSTKDTGPCCARVAKFIVPLTKGQIVRSDIIPRRLVDCELIESTVSFANPLHFHTGNPLSSAELCDLQSIFSASTAGMLLKDAPKLAGEVNCRVLSHLVESELTNRLSFPWIITQSIPRKKLAIVEGGFAHPDDGGNGSSIYTAAKSLGIDIVVLDNAGHWLEGPKFSEWREAFLPTKLVQPPDAEFADRIVQSIQSYHGKVDAIVTFCDSYQVPVAEAAQRLGLETPGPTAYDIATDKFKLSVFEGRDAKLVSGTAEALELAGRGDVNYPAIVKPCSGWCSEGVMRIDNTSDFLSALERMQNIEAGSHGNKFVIEPYCSGPEVDANFVLFDGEILFFEVSDDFPKSADMNGATEPGKLGTFQELDGVYPSQLPAAEQSLLRVWFHNTLLRLGLRNGVMHLEGRVDNSAFEYRSENGLLDLHARGGASKDDPSPWLIEINPRPLGLKAAEIIESTYGIDYWGLALIIAVHDKERAKALTRPFLNGPQYTSILVLIQTDYDQSSCEGIFDSEDICLELCTRRPDLAKQISSSGCFTGQK
ncbi:hypothetical protein PENFLA_c014G01645 [Penicillium flavigenum]|uniref:ATP-grasp domain-containing protein n=1 Tax=Penicillium flavigenum TaxID=254877 RepID=A0A1V6T6M5_9EURO|nr:hypothetical protein PENFLA_c014G01645 [Penicillium flavigenum]